MSGDGAGENAAAPPRNDHGAKDKWTLLQKAFHAALLGGITACAWMSPETILFRFSVLLLTLYGIIICVKVVAVLAGVLRHNTEAVPEEELRGMDEAALPVYTVLLPVYREADVLAALVDSLKALDYPKDKLDAKILLERDDLETIARARAMALPSWIETLVVPEGTPRTKPRACNYGLERARGEYLVVYDAEDKPEPDQLKKAVAAFARLPARVKCLQAKLNYYNSRENRLTRWFALEYSAWFDLYLPGLHAVAAPIPLGGTSNHLRVAELKRIGGWDPYNVTEDCDLGMRLEQRGWETRILDSTTWEEAVNRWGPWIRQRSRWTKGYWQTYLCQTRNPLRNIAEMGLWKWLMMLVIVGGQVFSLLMNPLCWIMAACWLLSGRDVYDPSAPASVGLLVGSTAMALFNGLFVIMHALAAVRRRRFDLLPLSFLMPLYWVMVSVGAWRGFIQFFSRPFEWEKTPHGLLKEADGSGTAELPAPGTIFGVLSFFFGRRKRAWTAAVITAAVAAICFASLRAPEWIDRVIPRRASGAPAAVLLQGRCVKTEIPVGDSWFEGAAARLELSGRAAGGAVAQAPTGALRAVVFLKVWDGEWFQRIVDSAAIQSGPGRIAMRVGLEGGWRSVPPGRIWGRWCLRRVRSAGVRLYGDVGGIGSLRMDDIRIEGGAAGAKPLCALNCRYPLESPAGEVFEAKFNLSREYPNPFDPDQVDVCGVFSGPGGAETRVPAFYTRDFDRQSEGGAEVLLPEGVPYWAVRFMPREPGRYRWRLEGRDSAGGSFRSEPVELSATGAVSRGFAAVDRDRRFFSFDNGDFFYPVGINLRSPADSRVQRLGHKPEAEPESGTFAMERFIDRMSAAGMTLGRMWMTPWWGGLEWNRDREGYHGLGVYNLQNAWRFDRLLDYAQRKGVLLEIALNAHGGFTQEYDSEWDDNPYNRANGGPIGKPPQTMTDGKAKRLFKNRFRYAAARFGSYPALFAWTLWIEANVVNDNPQCQAEWHSEMAGYLKTVDYSGRPVSTEFNSMEGLPEVWELPEIGYTQVAAYNRGRGLADRFREASRALGRFGKPVILEEYGGHAQGGSAAWVAHEIHDGLWEGWVLPISGAPMAWWWNFVFDRGLDRWYARFAEFIRNEDLRGVNWRYRSLPVDGATDVVADARYASDRAFLWIRGTVSEITMNGDYWRMLPSGVGTYEAAMKGFDSLAEDPGNLFGPFDAAGIDLAPLGLDDGEYAAEFWDAWSAKPPERKTFTVNNSLGAIELPRLGRNMAVKIRRTGAHLQHP